jgi:hypothetical protein
MSLYIKKNPLEELPAVGEKVFYENTKNELKSGRLDRTLDYFNVDFAQQNYDKDTVEKVIYWLKKL